MRNTLLLIISLMVTFTTAINAQKAEILIDSANKYYNQGKYHEAIDHYERVLNQGLEAPGLYYNLGNAYYKSHQLAPAILNYEKALKRDPTNEDVRYNLQLARTQITDKIDKIPEFFISRWITQLMDVFPSDTWSVLSMVTFILFLILFSVYLYTRRYTLKRSSFWVGLLALALAVASFVFASQQKQEIVDSNQAIVFAPGVTVKSSPAQSGTDLFVIHEGTKVFIQDDMGEWYEIRLTDGSQGWLKKDTVEPI